MTSSCTILVRYTVKLLSEQLFSRVPIVNKNALLFLIFSVRREGGKGVVKVISQLSFTSKIFNISSKKKMLIERKTKRCSFFIFYYAPPQENLSFCWRQGFGKSALTTHDCF